MNFRTLKYGGKVKGNAVQVQLLACYLACSQLSARLHSLYDSNLFFGEDKLLHVYFIGLIFYFIFRNVIPAFTLLVL